LKKIADVLQDDVPADNSCLCCSSDLRCVRGYNASPYSVYVHECPVCGESYLRIVDFSRGSMLQQF